MAAAVSAYTYFGWPGGPAHPLYSKFTVTGDASPGYPAGGIPISKAQAGFPNGTLVDVQCGVANNGGTHYTAVWDDVNQKIKLINTNTGADLTAGTNLSAVVITCVALGIS